jgi:hypothetical protein
MKTGYVVLLIVVAAAVAALVWHLHSRHGSEGPLVHVENGFEFSVHAPYESVAPLFGAYRERDWGGEHWNPRFLYPQPPRDIEGEVFTVAHGHAHSIWVNTALDLQAGHIQYVYVIPEAQAVLIDIHLRHDDPANTGVKVVYQRTALDPRFNQHLTAMGKKDRQAAGEWQSAIEGYLHAGSGK